jgi:light-regulated signal transduction histidine kinase (bacteriophytochrome)
MSSNHNYDSELCGKVPIHLINTIQPYGVLLVLSRSLSSLGVIQASENAAEIFGVSVQEFIGSSIGSYLEAQDFAFLGQIAAGRNTNKIPLVWSILGKKYLSLVHIKNDFILAELWLEPYQDEIQRSFVSIYQEIKYSMALIEGAASITEVCAIATRELKRISGFDKVMIYRFDKEWNGTVISEEREDDMESYFGFTFPASDIPRQARELYLRNSYRFIPDRTYQPVKLYPVINPSTQTFIDLSDCNVRGIVAVHLEYLANMGVTASMSTRILNNDQLWGLIACHHKTARSFSFELCSVFELFSNVLSARMQSLQNKEKHDADTRVRDIYNRLVEQVYLAGDIRNGLLEGDSTVLQLFAAQGAVITGNGQLYTKGVLPDRDSLDELILWLHTRRLNKALFSDHLSGHFDRAARYMDYASGVLAIPFRPEQEGYLLLFRAEVKKVIDWGGDPGGRIVYEKDGLNYHPRHSFKVWRQTVDGTCLPWQEEEIAVADTLRSFLYEYTSKKT